MAASCKFCEAFPVTAIDILVAPVLVPTIVPANAPAVVAFNRTYTVVEVTLPLFGVSETLLLQVELSVETSYDEGAVIVSAAVRFNAETVNECDAEGVPTVCVNAVSDEEL